MTTTLGFDTYLDHLTRESRRFRDALAACDLAAPVPTCPDWNAADLLWHLTEVQGFWSRIVRQRPATPQEIEAFPERPDTLEGLLAAFDEHSAALRSALAEADPTDTAWTWSAEQTVGFTYRRQAHEALIHRLDAEITAGLEPTPLDPGLSADGVMESLDVMYGGCPPWGTSTGSSTHLRVDLTDTGHQIWVQLGRFTGTDPTTAQECDEPDLHVVAAPDSEPDAVIRGTAATLDAWLWHRVDDAEVEFSGDRGVHDRFRAIVNTPLT